tara:strand:+ start:9214 stop:11328 length:2115 start_codon:yes stop_codon:yes gene_type:complete
MNNTRIEILKEGIWIYLELGQDKSIRYNSVINKIGKTSTREISGSNTFSIPWTYHNVQTLGLNQFNSVELAASLNQKYEAKYYNEDTLFQVGFVVINNMDSGPININFIDKALFITEKWGAASYNDLLKDPLLTIPTDYQTAISEMVNYNITKVAPLSHLTNISGETFPLALFPNNLNQIGDKWQIYQDGSDHVDDGINPYQSRPIFNAKAFITLACKAYGYDPIFHPSIDWAKVAKTYMVTKGLEKSQYGDGGLVGKTHPLVLGSFAHWIQYSGMPLDIYRSQVAMDFPAGVSITPDNLTGFPSNPPGVEVGSPGGFGSHNSIFVPNVYAGNIGLITFKATVKNTTSVASGDGIWSVYKDTTITNGYVFENTSFTNVNDTTTSIEWIVDKSVFDTPSVPNAGDLVGVYLLSWDGNGSQFGENMTNMTVSETYSPTGLISYDEHGQYLQDAVDLTYATSTETISSLIKGLMQKEGMLMNIDSKNKEIEFFAYSAYSTRRDAGEFEDWSKYLLEYSNPKFNTNYGNNYAISNKVGLSGPYPGNSVKIILGNQTSSSKYKDSAEDYNSTFKDVVSAQKIIYTNTPYTEYETSETSLVELDTTLGNLNQYRYASSSVTQGVLTGLPAIYNVNFVTAPDGVSDWYNLIDNSVRGKPSFLLPLDVVKNLDLRKPIFISQLGGYYIPEEVEQYIDSKTPVSVKLIKLNIS